MSMSCVTMAAEANVAKCVQEETNKVLFSNIDNLKMNEKLEIPLKDSNGNDFVIGIEAISPVSRSSSTRTFRVYYEKIAIQCEFYMDVTNNEVSRAYNPIIKTLGGTYDDKEFVRSTTYAKLSFKYIVYENLGSQKCWLKGTVTGSDNDISVTWSM